MTTPPPVAVALAGLPHPQKMADERCPHGRPITEAGDALCVRCAVQAAVDRTDDDNADRRRARRRTVALRPPPSRRPGAAARTSDANAAGYPAGRPTAAKSYAAARRARPLVAG